MQIYISFISSIPSHFLLCTTHNKVVVNDTLPVRRRRRFNILLLFTLFLVFWGLNPAFLDQLTISQSRNERNDNIRKCPREHYHSQDEKHKHDDQRHRAKLLQLVRGKDLSRQFLRFIDKTIFFKSLSWGLDDEICHYIEEQVLCLFVLLHQPSFLHNLNYTWIPNLKVSSVSEEWMTLYSMTLPGRYFSHRLAYFKSY